MLYIWIEFNSIELPLACEWNINSFIFDVIKRQERMKKKLFNYWFLIFVLVKLLWMEFLGFDILLHFSIGFNRPFGSVLVFTRKALSRKIERCNVRKKKSLGCGRFLKSSVIFYLKWWVRWMEKKLHYSQSKLQTNNSFPKIHDIVIHYFL